MIVLGCDMEEPREVELPTGRAVVYSHSAPDRAGANEDGAAILVSDTGQGVLAVADGMGGGPAGEAASGLALRQLAERVAAPATEAAGEPRLRGAILDAAEAANQAIRALGVGAATTLAAAELAGRMVRPYHAGDSCLLVCGQRGRLKYQTVAHSPVGYAVESGLLDHAEALHHDDRHLVSNMLGTADMRMEVASPLELARWDTLVLGTDGLFDNLTVPEVIGLVRKGPLPAAAGALVDACRRRMSGAQAGPSKPDDVTFILYRPGGAGAA